MTRSNPGRDDSAIDHAFDGGRPRRIAPRQEPRLNAPYKARSGMTAAKSWWAALSEAQCTFQTLAKMTRFNPRPR
jgi:hypothetical protein